MGGGGTGGEGYDMLLWGGCGDDFVAVVDLGGRVVCRRCKGDIGCCDDGDDDDGGIVGFVTAGALGGIRWYIARLLQNISVIFQQQKDIGW